MRTPHPSLMRLRRLVPLALLFLAACASTTPRGGSPSTTAGSISIAIEPNPIVARQIKDEIFEFPFEVIVRETGGQRVDIQRVTADVFALGGFKIESDSYDRAKIVAMGYPTSVPANGELRIRIAERHEVADARLLNTVRVELRAEAIDANGIALTSTTSVTVRR